MTALDGVALVEGENGGNHWCAEEEEEEEQKDPQRGLLSGARAETAGQAHWDLYPPRQRNRGAAEKGKRQKYKCALCGQNHEVVVTRVAVTRSPGWVVAGR